MYGLGFPGGSDGEESACNAGDPGLIPGSRRSPGEGNGNPFQYSCLENSMDRGAGWATVHGVTELDMTEQSNMYWGLLGGAMLKNPPANAGDTRHRFDPWVRIPWRRKWQPTPVFLLTGLQ